MANEEPHIKIKKIGLLIHGAPASFPPELTPRSKELLDAIPNGHIVDFISQTEEIRGNPYGSLIEGIFVSEIQNGVPYNPITKILALKKYLGLR